jgi:hypothetical protein
MNSYEVALWRYWPSMFPEWIEDIEDFSPQSAMYAAMRLHGLRFVQKAAVGQIKTGPGVLPGACIALQRFYHIVCPRLVEVSAND